jgi:hypothetical protein
VNAAALERFLARLYTDDALRRAFLAQPDAVARAAGLDEATAQQLMQIDREGLALAADSYARKRAAHAGKHRRAGLWSRVRAAVAMLRGRR